MRLSPNTIHVSRNSGRTFDSFNQGLPDAFIPLRVAIDREQTLYLATYSSGLYKRAKSDASWRNISPPDSFERTIHADSPKRFRKISAFAVHPENTKRLAVAAKHALYFSSDGGLTWKEFSVPPQLRKHYFTALAFSPANDALLAGSSFGGMFIMQGNALRPFSSGLPAEKYSATLDFFDECGAIAVSEKSNAHVAMHFSGAIYSLNSSSRQWKKRAQFDSPSLIHDIAEKESKLYASVNGLIVEILPDGETRFFHTLNESIKSASNNTTIGMFIADQSGNLPPLFIQVRHPFDANQSRWHAEKAAGIKALYANPMVARKNIDRLIDVAKQCGLNAVVIDMKDDFGALHFPTKNQVAKQIGSCRNPLDVQMILQKLHANNMYAIARIVVFKDKYLYQAYGGAHAVSDSATGRSWMGNPGEYWLDPHSSFVHTYVVDLAKELAQLGFDEIQFDYIRFPSDGPIERCRFPHRKDSSMFKSEAILDFLRLAKKTLSVPISIDVYGITGWYHFGNRIGQDFEAISEYVDALCPMVYPSHFGTTFYRHKASREELPGLLVGESIARAQMLVGKNAIIRPYLQAFNLLSPTWGPNYILTQIRAAEKNGARGYSFWNAKGDYEMIKKALVKNK